MVVLYSMAVSLVLGDEQQMRRRGRNGRIARLGPAIKIANLTGSPNAENYQVADSGRSHGSTAQGSRGSYRWRYRCPLRDPLREPLRDPLREPLKEPLRDPLRDH